MKTTINVIFTVIILLFGSQTYAQTKIINGSVLDSKDRSPISGASVKIKNTKIGVSTNAKGQFSLTLPVDAKSNLLEVSNIGFENKTVAITENKILILLESSENKLDEIVVVGYGSQKKESVTGAITQIDSKTLANRPITNIAQGLQGAIGNLNITANNQGGAPGSKLSVNVRGFTGLGTSSGPLVVIDGVQGGDFNSLNPNDIESVTLIKDAAAAAVYGSSAPYGVLLITTKKGKTGAKPSINYSNNFTFSSPMGLPKMANSLDFANIINQARSNGGQNPFIAAEVVAKIKQYQAGTLKDETSKDPNSDSWLGYGGGNANNDWFKVYFKDYVPSQQHNLNISGGSESSKYYIGLGYNDNNGSYRYGKDTYQKFNIRTNLSSTVTNWLTFNLRANFTKEVFDSPNKYRGRTGNNYLHQIARKHPNLALKNPDGFYSEPSDVLLHEQGGRDHTTNDLPFITGEIVTKLAKNWNATANYTYDGTFQNKSSQVKTLYSPTPSGTLNPIQYTFPNSFERGNQYTQHQVLNLFSDYSYRINKHNFKILGGYVNESTDFTSFSASNQQLFSNNNPALSLTYGPSASISDNVTKVASKGVFGRFNYSYDDKYHLEVVGRYDGTSKFLSASRWKLYPGLSAGWNVHKEKFWNGKIAEVINTFKLRASYGSLGDQSLTGLPEGNIRTYPFYANLGTTVPTNTNWFFNGSREAAVFQPQLVNPNLTWVTTKTLDFGFDASFLKDRLTAQFDWYRRSMDDFIGPPEVLPAVFGAAVPNTNSAAFHTDGYEITLAWRDKIGDFSYGIRGILSDYVATITKYPNPSGLLSNWNVGQKMGDIWGYETDRYFTSEADYAKSPSQSVLFGRWGAGDIKYKDLNNDGKIDFGSNTIGNPGDRKVIGNSTPRYNYSFLTDFTYKNFDFQLFIQGVGKRDYFMGSNYFFGLVNNIWQSSVFTTHLDRWTPENPNGYFPKAYLSAEADKNIAAQSKYLINGAYLRIKNIQLGYNIPQNILNKIKVNKLRVYISLDNLATFSKSKEHFALDPEIALTDGKIYPLQRNYSFGLNLSL